MSESGGALAKIGARYEEKYTIHELLKLFDEEEVLSVEKIALETGDGVEYEVTVRDEDGNENKRYVQTKIRVGSKSQWTVSKLERTRGSQKPGVLADAFDKLYHDKTAEFQFVSNWGALLGEMAKAARKCDNVTQFKAQFSSADERSEFKALLEVSPKPQEDVGAAVQVEVKESYDEEEVFDMLQRFFMVTRDEETVDELLKYQVEAHIDEVRDVETVIAELIAFVKQDVSAVLNAQDVWKFLRSRGYEPTKRTTELRKWIHIANALANYERGSPRLLPGGFLPRRELDDIKKQVQPDSDENRIVFLTGGIGSGKTAVLGELCKEYSENGAVLPVIMRNHVFEDPKRLGQDLGFGSMSPVEALRRMPTKGPRVLVLDGIPVAETMEGRPLHICFSRLFEEAKKANPAVFIVFAGRTIHADAHPLNRDFADDITQVDMDPLEANQVRQALVNADLGKVEFDDGQIETFNSPGYLRIIMESLSPDYVGPIPETSEAASDILDTSYRKRMDNYVAKYGTAPEWERALAFIVQEMDSYKSLHLSKAQFGNFGKDIESLISVGVLVKEGDGASFKNESEYGYYSARSFDSGRQTDLMFFAQRPSSTGMITETVIHTLRYWRHIKKLTPYESNLRSILTDDHVPGDLKVVILENFLPHFNDPSSSERELILSLADSPELSAVVASLLKRPGWSD